MISVDVLDDVAVAKLLDCDTKTVQEKARCGLLPGIKIGRSWRFPRQALLHVLNKMALQNKPAKPAPSAVKVSTRQPPPDLTLISQAVTTNPHHACSRT